jgi:hypothetical protein
MLDLFAKSEDSPWFSFRRIVFRPSSAVAIAVTNFGFSVLRGIFSRKTRCDATMDVCFSIPIAPERLHRPFVLGVDLLVHFVQRLYRYAQLRAQALSEYIAANFHTARRWVVFCSATRTADKLHAYLSKFRSPCRVLRHSVDSSQWHTFYSDKMKYSCQDYDLRK